MIDRAGSSSPSPSLRDTAEQADIHPGPRIIPVFSNPREHSIETLEV